MNSFIIPGVRLCVLLFSFLCCSSDVFAHPHAFIDASFAFVFDSNGLKEIRSRWLHDHQTGSVLIADFDKDADGELSLEESSALASDMFKNLGDYNFFTQLKLGDEVLEINPASEDIRSYLQGGKLVFEFVIPCAVAAEKESYKMVQLAQYDPEYFIDFSYVGAPAMEGGGNFDYAVSTTVTEEDNGFGWNISVKKIILRFCLEEQLAGGEELLVGNAFQQGVLPTEDGTEGMGFFSSLYDDFLGWQKRLREQIEGLLQKDESGKMPFANLALLCLLVFFYGILHAAGPGHGKVLIVSWLSGRNYQLIAGALLGFLQAFFHGLSGVLMVLAGRYLLEHSPAQLLGNSGESLKNISFSLIMGLGLFIILKELRNFSGRGVKKAGAELEKPVDNQVIAGEGRNLKGREGIFFALAAGLVPCPGAVMIMLFCSAIQRTELGIILTVFFTMGMGLTIGMAGVFVILARKLALPRHGYGEKIERTLHLCSGILLLSLGAFFQFFKP
jgi:ABC-type nickel/cobalt efflux system permease component RcnA/ABC-type uncharacterized transport system substrate-binding protein